QLGDLHGSVAGTDQRPAGNSPAAGQSDSDRSPNALRTDVETKLMDLEDRQSHSLDLRVLCVEAELDRVPARAAISCAESAPPDESGGRESLHGLARDLRDEVEGLVHCEHR